MPIRRAASAVVVTAAVAAPILSGAAAVRGAEPEPVVVVNLPEVQAVQAPEPLPQARSLELRAVVAPAAPTEIAAMTDAGVVDVAGFTGVVLSLAAEVKGPVAEPVRIGAILVPDEPDLLRRLREDGVVSFALAVEAEATRERRGYGTGQAAFRLGFPRYRVLLYATGPHSAEATLFVYATAG